MNQEKAYYTSYLSQKTAIGSAMDVWPNTDYMQMVPESSQSECIHRYWKEAGKYLTRSIKAIDARATRKR